MTAEPGTLDQHAEIPRRLSPFGGIMPAYAQWVDHQGRPIPAAVRVTVVRAAAGASR